MVLKLPVIRISIAANMVGDDVGAEDEGAEVGEADEGADVGEDCVGKRDGVIDGE